MTTTPAYFVIVKTATGTTYHAAADDGEHATTLCGKRSVGGYVPPGAMITCAKCQRIIDSPDAA